ncbi:unnamed protein product [Cylicocyclus nassatus]|uniref:Uncharacterized protein n=1 Tax=Cylicocyclus nassatus TaxID=53992 RepID=A0AA36DT62_CYLNA|nr:unnamed protein product [Cylicocyclus nassatus]
MDTRALNETVECDLWNLSVRSLRRNLDIRREQAEILIKGFEGKTRDIEQITKSIRAQIIQYNRVVSERAKLINQLDEFFSEEKVLHSTSRRAGVEPLDLGQLEEPATADEGNNILVSESAADQQSSLSEDSTDVGIIRTASQSTVCEESLSYFDEEEKTRSSASSFTLHQSDVDDAKLGKQNIDAEPHPSRRTLDTVETLAMLSRQTVTVGGDENSLDDADQLLDKLIYYFEQAKVATIEEVSPEEQSLSDSGKLFDRTFTETAITGPMLPNAPSVEADQSVDVVDGMNDVMITPHENTGLEVSITNSGIWSEAEVSVPDIITHVSEDASTLETPSFIGDAADIAETAESGNTNLSPLEHSHGETEKVSNEGDKI